MLRYVTILATSLLLLFPTYWIMRPLVSSDGNAWALAALICAGFSAVMLKLWKVYPSINDIPIDAGDSDMRDCMRRSKSEFHRFEEALSEGEKEAYVKYRFQRDDGRSVQVWGVAHALKDGCVVVSLQGFADYLVSKPAHAFRHEENFEPRSKIPLQKVEDWMLIDNEGRAEGGYTHLALVKIYRRLHGKIPRRYLQELESCVDIDSSEYS